MSKQSNIFKSIDLKLRIDIFHVIFLLLTLKQERLP